MHPVSYFYFCSSVCNGFVKNNADETTHNSAMAGGRPKLDAPAESAGALSQNGSLLGIV